MISPDENTQSGLHFDSKAADDHSIKISPRPLGYFFWFFIIVIIVSSVLIGATWLSVRGLIGRQERQTIHLTPSTTDKVESTLGTMHTVTAVPESGGYPSVKSQVDLLVGLMLLSTALIALLAATFFRRLKLETERLLTLACNPYSIDKEPTAVITIAEFEQVANKLKTAANSRNLVIAELTESKQRYYELFESIDEGFCLIEMIYDEHQNPIDWRYMEANPAFEKQTGFYGAVGKRILELAPGLEPYWFEVYANVALTGQPIRLQNVVKALDSTWIDLYAFRVGEPGYHMVAVLFKNITEDRKLEGISRAATKYTRSLLEASLDPLITISADGQITDVNEASVQVTGVPRERLIGTDFCNYFTAPDQARIGYRRVFSEEFVRDYPLAIRHTSGKIIDVLYNASVYKDDDGNVLGVFAAARDVTVHNHLDRVLKVKNVELQTATTLAETANLAKSNFLSSMSHELRTPLNAVLGYAQLIESGTPPPTPLQKESLNQILKGGWYLLELINEILDLSQIESGKSAMLSEAVSVREVMIECQAMIENQARQRDIELKFPSLEVDFFVKADRMRLKQVLINLFSNAIKYNRRGGTVEVDIQQTLPQSDLLRISVRDTGIGMSPGQLAQLFQPFNRLGRELGSEQGTGIGLAVTKQLVELMGGVISVESTVEVGSKFWIELESPSALQIAARHIDIVPLEEAKLSSKVSRKISEISVLCVEDNPANMALLAQLVSLRPNLRLLCATNGEDGIKLAQSDQPTIIFLDINLPGISGIEVMKFLRADRSTAHIPIVAISANATANDIDKGIDAGFFAYMTKPIVLNHFMNTLDMALGYALDNAHLKTIDGSQGISQSDIFI